MGKRKRFYNALFLVVIFFLTIWSVFHGEDLRELKYYLIIADNGYIAAGIVCVLLFILGESLVICYLLHSLGLKPQITHCCLYSFIGFFYSCITPSASGGQPMQVVAMRKDKIPVAVSSVVLAIVTITYKLVLVVIGVFVMVLRPPTIMIYLDALDGLIYLGLALNVGCIILLFLLVFRPAIVRKCGEWVIGCMNRLRSVHRKEKLEAKLDELMAQYTGTADYYRNHKLVILNVFLITLAQRAALFVVTWLAYRAFNLSGERLFVIVLLQAMISVTVDMMPLPGGMGISENLFLQIFLPVFGSELVLPGMVISRGISYYTQLIISAVMTVVASFAIRTKD